jgi:hypothetical protein
MNCWISQRILNIQNYTSVPIADGKIFSKNHDLKSCGKSQELDLNGI